MAKLLFTIKGVLFFLLLLTCINARSQTISGPTVADGGSTWLYVASMPGASSYTWTVANGTYVTACGGGAQAAAVVAGGIHPMAQPGSSCDSIYVTWSSTATSGLVSVQDNLAHNASLSVTIYPLLHNGAVSPLSQTINCNTTGQSITVANATGGNGTYYYQWQTSTDSATWVNTSFGNTQIFNITTNPTQKTYVRSLVQSYDMTAISAVSVINIANTAISVGAINTGNQTIPYHSTPATMAATLTGGNCSVGAYAYQWQSSQNGTTFSNITGAIQYDYNPGIMDASLYYRLQVSINGLQTVYSSPVLITVIQPFLAGAAAVSPAVVAPGGSATLTATAATGDNCGSYTYSWQSSTDEVNWVAISSTATNVSVTGINTSAYYRRKAVCGSDSVFTNEVTVKVKAATALNTPNGVTAAPAGTQTVSAMPGYGNADTANMNYIFSYNYTKPGLLDTGTALSNTSIYDVQQVNAYFDGLARPVQTVAKQATPAQHDLISTTFYDPLQREALKYLPYTDNAATGTFRVNAATTQPAFYNQFFNNTENYYYSTQQFENSVLNRVLKQTAPGKSWTGVNTGPRTYQRTNTAYDSVLIWTIGYGEDSLARNTGYYAPGSLWVLATTDENFNQTIEYKDMQGHVVLKKAQVSDATSTGYYGWACTYYVYDDLQNLRFVMQPMATDWLRTNSWVITAAVANEFCFEYSYDKRRRMVTKKVPGAGKQYLVYDARDRAVMAQDSSLRAQGNWEYTDYDSLNRPVLTGLWASSGNRVAQQSLADTSIIYPVPASGYTILTQTYYDDYSWVGGSGSGLGSSAVTTYNTNTAYFYTASNTAQPYPQAITATSLTRGMVTGTKTNVVNTTTYLYGVSFYDDHGRVVQTQSTNYTGSKDTLVNQYDFSGRLLSSLLCHGKGGGNPQGYKVLTQQMYDAMGRVTQVTQKTGSSPGVVLAKNQYDELGQLALKNMGQSRKSLTDTTYSANPIDTLRYTYNIRGWVKGINKDYANAANSAVNWFGMELGYDYGFVAPQINGNIAGIKWRNAEDGQQRAYGFAYDNLNRLSKADFTQNAGSNTWNTIAGIDFSVHSISYDLNGNILTLNQMGVKVNTSTLVDSLAYGYNTNSNRLNYVTDRVNDTTAHLGDFTEITSNTNQDYNWDGNGNLTLDNNKNITLIHYNYLNLPDSIRIKGKGYIKYVYDAAGIKLQKITTDSTASPVKISRTDYAAAFVYLNDTLQYAASGEGRVRPKTPNRSDTMLYDYFEKDHLGNIRVVLTDEKQQDVYPAATLETIANVLATEKGFYTINMADTISTSRIASWGSTAGNNYKDNNGNPPYNNNPAYPGLLDTATSKIVYRLNGNTGDKTGLGITVKVMAGDAVNIYGKSFWHNNGTISNGYPLSGVLQSFLLGFAGTGGVTSAGKGSATAISNDVYNSTADVNSLKYLLDTAKGSSTSVPKAYINWILFDDNFNPVKTGSGFDAISTTADNVKPHNLSVSIATGGYLYVYCSNESNTDVFFDNLQVIQTRGPLLETDNYYPFGLAMAGISSQAAGKLENLHKYNKGSELQHKEFSDGNGLETYATQFRMLDPQLGRWWQIDPKPNYAESPYSSMGNNPILRNDPLGDKDSVARKTLIVPIPQKAWPNVYKVLKEYIASGRKQLLTYDSDKNRAKSRSTQALKGHPEAKPGNQLHEFPPKMTEEGGKGAIVKEIPAEENQSEGGTVGRLIQLSGLKTGDNLYYLPIADDEEEPDKIPVVGVQQKNNNGEGTQNAPGKVVNMTREKTERLQRTAAAVGAGYVLLKTAEVIATILTEGLAAPTLAF